MGDQTGIEWTRGPDGRKGATWNPVVGCSIHSPGCKNCYAMRHAARLERMEVAKYAGLTEESKAGPVWKGVIRFHEPSLLQPILWARPRSIFVNSMSDLFHADMNWKRTDEVFAVMALARRHRFMVLTKRGDIQRAYMGADFRYEDIYSAMGRLGVRYQKEIGAHPFRAAIQEGMPWPLPNIWQGVSVESRAHLDRIDHLRQVPAAVRFLSIEPLLEDLGQIDLTGINWVIVGGESGKGARPMHLDWVRSIRDQCAAAGVAFFFKQWGAWAVVYDRDAEDPDWRHPPQPKGQGERYLNLAGGHGFHGDRVLFIRRMSKKRAGRTLDGRTHEEFPETAHAA